MPVPLLTPLACHRPQTRFSLLPGLTRAPSGDVFGRSASGEGRWAGSTHPPWVSPRAQGKQLGGHSKAQAPAAVAPLPPWSGMRRSVPWPQTLAALRFRFPKLRNPLAAWPTQSWVNPAKTGDGGLDCSRATRPLGKPDGDHGGQHGSHRPLQDESCPSWGAGGGGESRPPGAVTPTLGPHSGGARSGDCTGHREGP